MQVPLNSTKEGSVTRRVLLLLCILASASPAFAQTWSTVSLSTKDLAYSPLTQRLYATTPANNSVQEIDPFTGALLRSLFVGSQPNKLAVSDTGSHMYVGLDGAAAVARVNLATFTVDLQFSVGVDDFSGPLLPHDIAVQPGNPNVLAVVRKPSNSSATRGVAIFESGVLRPAVTTDFYTVTELEFSATPSRLYGYDDFSSGFEFSRLRVDGSGVTRNDSVGNLIQGYYTDIKFDAGRIYGSDGRAIDPEARVLLGTFPLGDPFRSLVRPNMATGAVHFITQTLGSNAPVVLRRFDPITFLQVDEDILTGVVAPVSNAPFSSLVSFGTDGLAFRTESNQLVLIRTGIPVSQPPSITITSPTTAPGTVAPGASITLSGTAGGSVSSVAWASDRGFTGAAAGTAEWFAGDIPLVAGTNVITVTAVGPVGTATDTLTVDVSTLSYFLAEGATGAFFDLDIALANPGSAPAPVEVAYLREGGGVTTQTLTLPPTSRTTIRVDDVQGLAPGALSTVVTSTSGTPLVAERTMRWDGEGQYGSHTEKAMAGTATKWYFAEGSQGFFFTYLLLANPNSGANVATVDWLVEGTAPVQRTYNLPPNSRTTIDPGADAALVGRSFGIVVTFDLPGSAERTMYFGAPPDVLFKAGHNSAGVNAPSTIWFMAEGATGPFFETFVLLANPNTTPVVTELKFLPQSGAAVTRSVTIPARGRLTVNLEALTPAAPELANAAVATQVTAPLPIIVERAQYWPYAPSQWYEAHNSAGVTAPAHRWGLAEGRVGNPAGFPPANYQTFVLLANPGGTTATVTLTFLRSNGATVERTVTVPALSRRTVAVSGPQSSVPELVDETFATIVDSTQPIAVERAMYGSPSGQPFGNGTNATGTRLPF
jgi:hypothetical protein